MPPSDASATTASVASSADRDDLLGELAARLVDELDLEQARRRVLCTHVVHHHVVRQLVERQLDEVVDRRRRALVDERQRREAGEPRRLEQRRALRRRVVRRHGDRAVAHLLLGRLLGERFRIAQYHARQLLGRQRYVRRRMHLVRVAQLVLLQIVQQTRATSRLDQRLAVLAAQQRIRKQNCRRRRSRLLRFKFRTAIFSRQVRRNDAKTPPPPPPPRQQRTSDFASLPRYRSPSKNEIIVGVLRLDCSFNTMS
jgi:hypothetical protein